MTVSLQLQAEPWICHMIAKLLSLWFELKMGSCCEHSVPSLRHYFEGYEAFRKQSLADRNRSPGANSEGNLLALAYLDLFLVGHLMKNFSHKFCPPRNLLCLPHVMD